MIITDRTPLPLLRPAFAELEGLYEPWDAAAVAEPRLVVLNEPLAAELGLDVEELRSPRGVAALVGEGLPEGTTTLAQAYAGHQFGGYSPRLGDGRALLLGELVDRQGRRRDLHLKGSGPTPFARGGDGRAALGPMLREHLVGEAMHALGIPTTRALAVITTGEPVAREVLLPGAVLARVASSHLRVGTFQYVAAQGDVSLLRRLADHAIARHYPAAADAAQPYVALFEAVVEAQAALVARWMLVGFVHGVMNTDNTSISGETLDYGPCAFMDAYDPATVFSSIDHGGRYAFGNQPRIVHWNLARLGEAMLALFADELDPAVEAANGVLRNRCRPLRAALARGHAGQARADVHADPADGDLARDLLDVLHAQQVDFTSCFRALSAVATGDADVARPAVHLAGGVRFLGGALASPAGRRAAASRRRSPQRWIAPTPHTSRATTSWRKPSLRQPAATSARTSSCWRWSPTRSTSRSEWERYAQPAPASAERYRTFCGT